jgi:hypothetical protein
VEIAALLGRHKSFVCRRLRMVEALSDEVPDHLKLGLINMTTGRELSRLPHGNQALALRTVIKYRLNCAETCRLISMVLKEPRWNHESILHFPEPILTDRQPERPWAPVFWAGFAKWKYIWRRCQRRNLKSARARMRLPSSTMFL